MRILLLAILTISVPVLSVPAFGEDLRAGDEDKQLHFAASYAINTSLLAAMPKRARYKKVQAAAMTAAVGVAKELSDPVFSGADLAADGLGILASSFLSFTYEF
jgi:hypothetical protein